MSDLLENRTKRFKTFIESLNITQTEFAKRVGKSPQQINSILRGIRNLGEQQAREFEKALGLEQGFFDVDENVETFNLKKTRKIPILSWVQAGKPQDTGCCYYDEFVMVDDYCSEDSYALRVFGDSMTPEFNEGDVLIVDGALKPHAGSFVIARITHQTGTTETTLKQYAIVGVDSYGREVFELRPLNTLYPKLRSDALQIEVIGVVVENRKKYR